MNCVGTGLCPVHPGKRWIFCFPIWDYVGALKGKSHLLIYLQATIELAPMYCGYKYLQKYRVCEVKCWCV